MRSRLDDNRYRDIAEKNGISESAVKSIVTSFFDAIYSEARNLQFNSHRKIYSKAKFDEYVHVQNIPFIGRIGPSYTRYLQWRVNESKDVEQRSKDDYSLRLTPEDIEEAAKMILAGEKPDIKKRKPTDMYNKVWLVGVDGKRQARQVIPKQIEENVQD